VDEAKGRIREVTAEDVRRRLVAVGLCPRGPEDVACGVDQEGVSGERFYLVDVREDGEWDRGRIQGARHLGKGIIERDVETDIPNPDADIVLYCGGGFRSALAADALQRMGYRNVASMDGGWKRWRQLGYPTEGERERPPTAPRPAQGGLWP